MFLVLLVSLSPLFIGARVAAQAPRTAPEDASLVPLGSLHRPIPVEVEPGEDAPRLRGCPNKPPPALKDRLPFGPGEQLSFDVALLGVRTGKVNLRMGERAIMDGVATYPLHAQAKSDGFLQVFGDFDARMVSFFDPRALLPVRMVNRTVVQQPFKERPYISREDGAFAAAHVSDGNAIGGIVNARLRRTGPDANIDKTSRLRSSADVVDLLSVIYYLRSRELTAATPVCFELYHRRRLWHVEGTVKPSETRSAPIGSRKSIRLEAVVTRVGGKDPPPPRPVTVWISDDADRLPVLVSTPDKMGNIEIRLLSHTRGRRLVEK